MKLSIVKKLDPGEFPGEVRGWIVRLLGPLNKFFEQAYLALSKGITIADNLKAQTFEVDIQENQSWPMKVSWTLNERPTCVFIGYIATTPEATIPVHSLQWTFNDGVVHFSVNGLTTSSRYKMRLVGLV